MPPQPLPPVPGVVRIDHTFNAGSDANALVRCHAFYTGGPPEAADCNSIAASLSALYSSELKALCSANNELNNLKVLDLSSDLGYSGQDATPVTGTRTGTNIPAGSALLVNYGIRRHYRGGKPRSYWPFFVSLDLVGAGAWQSASVTAAQSAFDAWLAGVPGITSGTTELQYLCSVSYFQGYNAATITPSGRAKNQSKLRSGGPVVDPITSVAVNPKPGSQRRRNLHSA